LRIEDSQGKSKDFPVPRKIKRFFLGLGPRKALLFDGHTKYILGYVFCFVKMFEFISGVHPLLFNLVVLVLSLVIVIKAADLLIFGISNYARKFGISDYLIGFLVLAIGTSLPELVSSLMGGSVGSSGVALGTILGSGVITITFVLGAMTVAAKKLNVKTKLLGKSTYFIWIMMLLPMVMLLDKKVSRLDGIVLIVVFFVYIFVLWKKEGTFGKLKKVKIKRLWKDVVIFLGALVALLLGARFLVFSSVVIAQEIGISSYIIALLVIGFGASLPDLTVELKSLKKGREAIGFGNVLGGITAEMLLILGIVAVIYPINIAGIGLAGLITTIVFFLFSMALVIFWVRKKQLVRWQGFVLLGLYLVFVAFQILLEVL
jgi:cation:H+ antiporter